MYFPFVLNPLNLFPCCAICFSTWQSYVLFAPVPSNSGITALQVIASTVDHAQLLDYTQASVRRYLKSMTDTRVVRTHVKFNCNTHVVHTYVKRNEPFRCTRGFFGAYRMCINEKH